MKSHFSRGLQSPSALVQHCSALALAKCLNKYGTVLMIMQDVQKALDEDDEDGSWSTRRKEVEREVYRRVPEFQVVIAFAQQKSTATPADGELPTSQDCIVATKAALLSESAQRLLWLYHRYMPQLVSEARFDVTKLISSMQENVPAGNSLVGLITLRQLHTLRLLNESEEFLLANKSGLQSHAYSYEFR
jgi:nucleolar pre-ribosomal-associated protein 1